MTDTEQKALALVNKVRAEYPLVSSEVASNLALCRAIEQHEAFRQEVSDAVEKYQANMYLKDTTLSRFIIAKPVDPLRKAMVKCGFGDSSNSADDIRAVLDLLGYEIREKAGE